MCSGRCWRRRYSLKNIRTKVRQAELRASAAEEKASARDSELKHLKGCAEREKQKLLSKIEQLEAGESRAVEDLLHYPQRG